MKINDGNLSDVEPQRLIILAVIVLIPVILGIIAVNLGFEGTSIIIFTGVYVLYPMGTVSVVHDFLKKEHQEIGGKVGIAILYLQIALTYSWSQKIRMPKELGGTWRIDSSLNITTYSYISSLKTKVPQVGEMKVTTWSTCDPS